MSHDGNMPTLSFSHRDDTNNYIHNTTLRQLHERSMQAQSTTDLCKLLEKQTKVRGVCLHACEMLNKCSRSTARIQAQGKCKMQTSCNTYKIKLMPPLFIIENEPASALYNLSRKCAKMLFHKANSWLQCHNSTGRASMQQVLNTPQCGGVTMRSSE